MMEMGFSLPCFSKYNSHLFDFLSLDFVCIEDVNIEKCSTTMVIIIMMMMIRLMTIMMMIIVIIIISFS